MSTRGVGFIFARSAILLIIVFVVSLCVGRYPIAFGEMFGAGLDAGVLWKIRLPRTAAVGGMIARVGMIVPHIARLIMEPDYRKLLPASLLIGAIFLLVVDDFARTLFAIELLLGMLTVLVGALMFWGRSCEQGENERDVYDYEGDECAGMEA